jgi:hypothetical protein
VTGEAAETRARQIIVADAELGADDPDDDGHNCCSTFPDVARQELLRQPPGRRLAMVSGTKGLSSAGRRTLAGTGLHRDAPISGVLSPTDGDQSMTVALITIVFVVAGFWLLYREPPKQRPEQAFGKVDRLAQRTHEVVQGRWYGKVAATVVVLAVGLAASQVFSSDTLTASTHTVTVTVSTPGDPPSTVPTTTPTTSPAPAPNHSVLGTWTGIVVNQNDKSLKYRASLVVRTTQVDVETVGSLTEKYSGGSRCFYPITATGREANVFTFTAQDTDPTDFNCEEEEISVERTADDTVAFTSGTGPDAIGTLRR